MLYYVLRFTKNLSPDKINLSTLKGEGELSNLELDEAILMELMDLPTWMRLTKAVCNKVSVKVRFVHFSEDSRRWGPEGLWLFEPRHEKTCLWKLRSGKTQTNLLSCRIKLES